MNTFLIKSPQRIQTTIQLPASKSISNRALIIRALAKGQEPLLNIADCDDTSVMTKALSKMPSTIDIGAAGTAMRFLTAYLCTQPSAHLLTGSERMCHRPIRILVDTLRTLGAHIDYIKEDGYPPLRIKGTKLQGGEIIIQGNVSSQYISALLLIAPIIEKGLTVHLSGEVLSRPYIDLTISLMEDFGARISFENERCIVVEPKPYMAVPYSIESDWSAASYWYEITALCNDSSINLAGLSPNSFQGDSRIAKVFEQLGIHTIYKHGKITLHKTNDKISVFNDNFSDIPDMAQTVVVTCALLDIPFRLEGLQSLKIKETDRIEALKTEMHKLGYVLHDEKGGSILMWQGEKCQPDTLPVIATHDDHRMAMAFAPAACRLGSIRIANPEVVSKSYINYWEDLKKADFRIDTI